MQVTHSVKPPLQQSKTSMSRWLINEPYLYLDCIWNWKKSEEADWGKDQCSDHVIPHSLAFLAVVAVQILLPLDTYCNSPPLLDLVKCMSKPLLAPLMRMNRHGTNI